MLCFPYYPKAFFRALFCILVSLQDVSGAFFSEKHAKVFNKDLQKEVLEMAEREQDLRMQWISATDSAHKEALREDVFRIDELHLSRLKEMIAEYGWPGFSLIGPEGSHAFWLLLQHTPDNAFQAQSLELLERAVSNQEASPIDLAYLKDRVYMYAGRKQIYGTQLNADLTVYPIEDEQHVNERRFAIGLPSLEAYMEDVKAMYRTHNDS